ncbi:BTB/POZ domain-containing protein KCTD12-like [Convolutriloba macropyga]|uniref:BTB/POZ domain-containing protein KCTD12-like n=1 Tax=Convolutriloba macropyga TaxID=536237 RepID=UPI003F51AD56
MTEKDHPDKIMDAQSAGALLSPLGSTVAELNIGGQAFTTTLETLGKYPDSLLGLVFSKLNTTIPLLKDTRGRFFMDRDGNLFRYILDYLRNDKVTLPEDFGETKRLIDEAKYFRLDGMVGDLKQQQQQQQNELIGKGIVPYYLEGRDKLSDKNYATSLCISDDELKSNEVAESAQSDGSTLPKTTKKIGGTGYITLGYRGTFAFGRDGLADIQFRKVMRILVHGKVHLCREVFGNSLNESRDPDRGSSERYSSRFFLKYNYLEQAFDHLSKAGFCLKASCASSANGTSVASETDNEETRWMHYTEFIFYRG